ncbi:MAG: serine--tRNA ligase [Pseudomonadota bacterium]
MFDLKFIRDNPDAFDAGLARRDLAPRAAEILMLDEEARKFTHALNELQARRNAASKDIGKAKAQGDEDTFNALRTEVDQIKTQIPAAEAEKEKKLAAINEILSGIPNIPADDAPQGEDESANVEVRQWGEPKRVNDAKEHFDLGEALGQMDFERAVKMSGSRFVLLKGQLARLERALASFMLDLHTQEYGYTECQPPLLVRDDALYGTGQLPKFATDLFSANSKSEAEFWLESNLPLEKIPEQERSLSSLPKSITSLSYSDRAKPGFWRIDYNRTGSQTVSHHLHHWLIPTAEVSLTNIVREEILDEGALPLRFTAWTPCFRSEAGAAGRDTRGMIRLHQFSKVELVSIVRPEDAEAEHERMTECAEAVLKRLELPYRTMVLSTGDMGFSARKTYDIEVWLPGQNQYREISSCSNCGDFQARRMNTRLRRSGDEKKIDFVHTLNGSGLAVGRTLVAVLENYQQADGSIVVPEVLKPYMGGAETIEAIG